jgi:hypothetical protein
MSTTNLDKLFKTDKVLEEEGIDFAIDEKTSFRVRHFSNANPKVKAAMAKYYKPYARQVELGTLDPAKGDEITMKLFIDTCLVSWTGIEMDGKPVECNKDNALTLFKRLPKLFDSLWAHANDFNNYREDLGNS